jgi:hypothetical protein
MTHLPPAFQSFTHYRRQARRIAGLLSLLVVLPHAGQAVVAFHDLNVGTGNVTRSVNWNERSGGGSWGVSRESFWGFTLTSLINGVEAGELSWVTNVRTLGVGGSGSIGNAANINRGSDGSVEAIRLDLPAANGLVGVTGGATLPYLGLSQVAFDRLTNGSGSQVTISGFVADPQASWAVAPGNNAGFTYNGGVLTFATGATADGWTDYGVIEFANRAATVAPGGVALVFSNNKPSNNAYGLVGWQYAVETDGLPTNVLHVSPVGSDDNSGLSPDAPLRTIQRAADLAQPGFTCYIHAGTYRETVTLSNSGRPGEPIVFMAYGDDQAVISGADPIDSGWVAVGGGVWKTAVQTTTQIEAVFFDGRMMMEARWPNNTWEDNWDAAKKWALTGQGSELGLVTNQALAASGIDLSGGQIYIKLSKGNSCFSRPITAHAAGAATFSWDATGVEGRAWSEDSMAERIATFGFVNNRFFVVARGALDAPGEWWHDVAAGELYFIPPTGSDPSLHEVAIKARVAAFASSGVTDIVIDGLHFSACNLELLSADRITVRNSDFIYSSTPRDFWDENTFMATHRPIYIRGHDNVVEACHIRWTIESPIELAGTGNQVVNCVIHDFNLHGRHPGPAVRLRGLATSPTASQGLNTALYNTVYNAGGVGLYAQGRWPVNLSYNHVFNVGIFTVDIAALYVPNGSEMQGSAVGYNWLHDVNGIGFRVDIEGRGMRFHNNLVWNARNGAKMQGYWLEVYNNTLIVNNPAFPLMIVYEPDASPEEKALWRVRNNAAYAFIDRKSLRASYAANPRPTTIPLAMVPGSVDYNVVIPAGDELLVFADPANFDFRPRTGGILDRTGVMVPGVAERMDGQPPSVGALEPEAATLWRPGANWRPDGRRVPATAREATNLAQVLLSASPAGPPLVYTDLNVGDGGVGRAINWNERTGSGSWGVASESFQGFTLRSLINGLGAGTLSWSTNTRTLGVDGSPANVGNVASINRSLDGSYIETIQLDLPASGALVETASAQPLGFAGIRQIALDRLTLGSGSQVTISGFVEDPEAGWAIVPGQNAAFSFANGTLTFSTGPATEGWQDFGLLEFANLNATATTAGLTLEFGNAKAGNNAYGLVGWRYAATPPRVPVAVRAGLSPNGRIALSVDGPPGADFLIQFSTNLLSWDDAELVSPPTLPFLWNEAETATGATRFYRVLAVEY